MLVLPDSVTPAPMVRVWLLLLPATYVVPPLRVIVAIVPAVSRLSLPEKKIVPLPALNTAPSARVRLLITFRLPLPARPSVKLPAAPTVTLSKVEAPTSVSSVPSPDLMVPFFTVPVLSELRPPVPNAAVPMSSVPLPPKSTVPVRLSVPPVRLILPATTLAPVNVPSRLMVPPLWLIVPLLLQLVALMVKVPALAPTVPLLVKFDEPTVKVWPAVLLVIVPLLTSAPL